MAEYFPNRVVQNLVIKYQDSGCTDVALRDQIMQYVPELAKQIIRKYTLYRLWGYPNASAAEDFIPELISMCWERIEKIIYKYDRTKKTSIFSQWTSVCILTVRAAAKHNNKHKLYMKRTGRIKMAEAEEKGASLLWEKFKQELQDIVPSREIRDIHYKCVEALLTLEPDDIKDQFIRKLLHARTGLKRQKISAWIKWLQDNSERFSKLEREPEELQLPVLDYDRDGL